MKSLSTVMNPIFDESIRILQFTYADTRYCLAKEYYDYFINSKYVTSYTIYDFIAPGRICRSAFYELIKTYPLDRNPISTNTIKVHIVLSDRIDYIDLLIEKIPFEWSLVQV